MGFTLIPNMWCLSTIWWLYSRLKVVSDEKTSKKIGKSQIWPKIGQNLVKPIQKWYQFHVKFGKQLIFASFKALKANFKNKLS